MYEAKHYGQEIALTNYFDLAVVCYTAVTSHKK